MDIFYRNHIFKYILYKVFKIRIKASNQLPNSFYLFYRIVFPFEKYHTTNFHSIINEAFNKVSKSGELEFLIKYNKGVTIEPNSGYALNDKSEILLFSLPYGDTLGTPFPHHIYYKKKKIIRLNRAVSIYYNWFNYWHFHNDILGQLYILDLNQFSKDIPILMPEKALNLEYVKYFLSTSFAKKWNWYFQKDNEYYKIDEIYFCKSIPNISLHFIFSKNIFQEKITYNSSSNRKIFLTRNSNRGRTISNIKELEILLKIYHFEIIDADSLSFKDQIILFSEAKTLCGIHGAGLTNMLFRHGCDSTIIEIFPENFIPVHYYWLSQELGFNYIPAFGSILENDSFIFPSVELERILKHLD